LILIIIKKVLGIKIILDIRSIPVEMSLPTDYKLSCNIASHFYDGATFITNGTKEYIEQLINKKFTHFAIFPSAVNPEFFSPLHINNVPDSIVQKTKGKIVLFYHGSISPNRGINIIIEAVNQVKDIFPNLLFISVSNRNDYISDYCKANNYELNEYLLLLDAVKYEEMAGYINLADICIVPLPRLLWWEISSPLKLMEYLAMEKPIVLSDIIAHKSVIPQDSKFALFFNPDDPNDLGKKINEAINNIKYLKANSFMGREIVLNKYTWDIQAKIIEDFIGVLH
jgi:glycosyltransferase involved in cell wall biosynthesis